MFDVPVESTYVWLGLVLVSATVLGLALRVPTAAPPDPTPVARTVDSVASSPYEATARHPIDARAVRIGPERLGLRGPGGAAHAGFAYDSVVPASGRVRLVAVLRGRPPAGVFESSAAFAAAVERARTADATWAKAPDRLLVRRVTWRGVNATLVGA